MNITISIFMHSPPNRGRFGFFSPHEGYTLHRLDDGSHSIGAGGGMGPKAEMFTYSISSITLV